MTFSRRGFLRFGMLAGFAKFLPAYAQTSKEPLFVEVPSSVSGIHWAHENAMSSSRFLPEALGPGCAFLDYDNDGWMDIFLVNSGPSDFWKPDKPVHNALYKNNRDGTFSDVTEKAGVAGAYFGMGVAVGDYDNDGWPDMLVTAYGRCTLYKNNHDGTFADVTEHAGIATPGFTTSAVWFDYDNDGRLDLFVCSFVDPVGVRKLECGSNQIGRNYYCVPRVFKPSASYLYHNNGDGTFSDVTFASGIGINNQYVAWGCGFIDYDNDGWADLLQVNGHVYPEIDGHNLGQTFKNPRLVYKNMGGGTFKDVSSSMGPGIGEKFSSRGAAFGDYDNDGDVDALVLNLNDLPSLLRNDGGNKQHWIKLKLIGTHCNRTAIGARVRLITGKHAQMDEVHSGSSVMSQSDLRLHFGLGKVAIVDVIEVKWPTTQKIERFTQVKADRILTIREGSGIVDSPRPK
jgi:enediyne biosynthesis protein E4